MGGRSAKRNAGSPGLPADHDPELAPLMPDPRTVALPDDQRVIGRAAARRVLMHHQLAVDMQALVFVDVAEAFGWGLHPREIAELSRLTILEVETILATMGLDEPGDSAAAYDACAAFRKAPPANNVTAWRQHLIPTKTKRSNR